MTNSSSEYDPQYRQITLAFCIQCGRWRPAEGFRQQKGRPNLQPYCRECQYAMMARSRFRRKVRAGKALPYPYVGENEMFRCRECGRPTAYRPGRGYICVACSLAQRQLCPVCAGVGLCPDCGGEGEPYQPTPVPWQPDPLPPPLCVRCGGTGMCPACEGSGQQTK